MRFVVVRVPLPAWPPSEKPNIYGAAAAGVAATAAPEAEYRCLVGPFEKSIEFA